MLVVALDNYFAKPPDYMFLLVRDYADAILTKENRYKKIGGKCILPIPAPEIV
jgi:hypothetical protein